MAGKGNSRETVEVTSTRSPTPFDNMIGAMSEVATADETEGRFSGDDLNAILAAETEEEIWEADDRPPLNFKHLAGCEIEILDFSVKYSRNAASEIKTPFVSRDGRKMYLLCTVVRLNRSGDKKLINLPQPGEQFEANTSARFVVAKIWAMWAKGKIDPGNGRSLKCLVQSTELGGDETVLKLRPVSAPVVQGTLADE